MRKRWKMTAGVAIAGAVAGWLIAAAQPKLYRVTATVVVRTKAADSGEMLHGLDVLTEPVIVNTIAAMAPIAAADVRATRDDLVESDVIEDTNLLTLSVTGRNASHVARLANALPAAMNVRTRPLFPMYHVALLDAVSPPARAAVPRPMRAAMAGLFAGLAAGGALAFYRERRQPAAARD
jgi:capsular polysaccharide biosynthesis protein